MILNEASGMISGMQTEKLKTQYDIAEKISFRHCEEIMIRRFWPGKQHGDLFVD
jgi:hypothetical protein